MIKWSNDRAILQADILVMGYSFVMYPFSFIFTVLWIQLSSFLPQKQIRIGNSDL